MYYCAFSLESKLPNTPLGSEENSTLIRTITQDGRVEHLEGGPEVVEAPGDDDVVVAAHQPRHHRAAVAHALQARVDLAQQTLVHMASVLPADVRLSVGTL